MKPHQRRAEAKYPYFKLAKWDATNLTFRDGKKAFETRAAAAASDTAPGKYRVSEVTESGRRDMEPHTVN